MTQTVGIPKTRIPQDIESQVYQHALDQSEHFVFIARERWQALSGRDDPGGQRRAKRGPGAHTADVVKEQAHKLKQKIHWCSKCENLAHQMDQNGPQWCRQHIDWLVEQMHSNAKEQKNLLGVAAQLGLGRSTTRRIIEQGIDRAEQDQ